MKDKVSAVILAAGSGSRMNLPITKQRLTVLGESILHRSVRAFDLSEDIDYIVVVTRADEIEYAKAELFDIKKLVAVKEGGKTRAESAKRGFDSVPADSKYVAIHDAARCCLIGGVIEKVVADAKKYGAATASHLVTDTVKWVDGDFIKSTADRSLLRTVQTPQVFEYDLYKRAIQSDDVDGMTDDNMLVEKVGGRIFCTETGGRNIKVTFPEDVKLLEYYLRGEDNEM